MDVAFMRKTFALIAKGLLEKETALQKEPTRYPYSKTLQHGINMFLSAGHQMGHVQNVFRYADEAMFLSHFVTKPVADWFLEWEQSSVDRLALSDEAFYNYGAFAYQRRKNVYVPSADCYEFLETQDSDILDGTDERILYEKMIVLDQETYTKIREYIIKKPIITLEERREMSVKLAGNQGAVEAFQFAYEEIAEDAFRCPCCGWTMTYGKYGYNCHSTHCTDTVPDLTDEMKLDVSIGDYYRLKKGIMRYFAAPGKLELDIAEYCEKRRLQWTLWPQMDRYDVEVIFPDGEIWEIDAKAYRNPLALRAKIQKDNGFPNGDYAKGFFVIPSEYTVSQRNYTRIINSALKNQDHVKCVTLRTLKSEIKRKEADCSEE